MAGIPQLGAVFGFICPDKVLAAKFIGNFAHLFHLLHDAGGRSVKFKKQGRRFFVVQLGIPIDGHHGKIVQQFGARNGNCRLDGLDHR